MVYSKFKQLYFDEPKSISDKKKKRPDSSNEAQSQQDCLSCRIISGGGLTMLGAYVIKHFYDDIRLDQNKVKISIKNNKSNHIFGFVLGAFLLSLGAARLANFQFRD